MIMRRVALLIFTLVLTSQTFGAEPPTKKIYLGLRHATSVLINEEGFDVDPREVNDTTGIEGLSIQLTTRVKTSLFTHRRQEISVDTRDHGGLSAVALLYGEQIQWTQERVNGRKIGFGLGIAGGIQRLRSFTDLAVTAVGEVNASVIIGAPFFGVEVGLYRRYSSSATLDERSAAPDIRGLRVTAFWRLWAQAPPHRSFNE